MKNFKTCVRSERPIHGLTDMASSNPLSIHPLCRVEDVAQDALQTLPNLLYAQQGFLAIKDIPTKWDERVTSMPDSRHSADELVIFFKQL